VVTLRTWTNSNLNISERTPSNMRLVVDAGFAYLDDERRLIRISVRDHRELQLATGLDHHGFDARSGAVYFAEGGMLHRAATTEDTAVALAPAAPRATPNAPDQGTRVSINSTHVFWLDDDRIMKSALSGAFRAEPSGASSDADFVASDTHLYPSTVALVPGEFGTTIPIYSLYGQPITGGQRKQLGPRLGNLAADERYAYQAFGSIDRFDPAKDPPPSALRADGSITNIGLDARDVYAAVAIEGCSGTVGSSCRAALERFPKDGSPSTHVRDLQELPLAVAVDASCMYWIQAVRVDGTTWNYALKLMAGPKAP
jgi:hypothetical protein